MVLNFDVANDEYLDFIQDLRDMAKDPRRVSHGRPVLPMQKDADGQHIDINIGVRGLGKGTLRIRKYDLRLMVYAKSASSLVYISDFDMYDDLGLLDLERVPVFVRPSTLVEAANFLADPQRDLTDLKEKDGVRSSLLALQVLLSEAAKVSVLAYVFDNVFKSGFEVPLYSWMLKLIRDWEYLSNELLAPYHEHIDCNYYLANPDDDGWHCDQRRLIGASCQDLARCLGILHGTAPTIRDEHLIEKPAEGRFIAEIYSVLVYIEGGKSGCIYGTIEVRDSTTDYNYSLYHRDPANCEHVQSDDTLTLEGPSGFIDAWDSFEMELDLKEKDANLPICKGRMSWCNSRVERDADQLLGARHSVLVKGDNGYAIVFYTVFENAVVATVEATLELNDGVGASASDSGVSDSDIYVSGSIVARSGGFNYSTEYEKKCYQTRLFSEVVSTQCGAYDQCTSGDNKLGKPVKLGFPMPLSRCVVAVDAEFTFTIEAKLQSSVGDPLVAGFMVMKPQDIGICEGVIGQPTDSYLLRLRVSWKNNHFD